jgi:hypothetical protein
MVRMRRILLAFLIVAALVPSVAEADPSAFKMTDLNFGNVTLGTPVSGTITLTNRSDTSPVITGWSFSALNSNSGWRYDSLTVGGSCLDLMDTRTPLLPGEPCVLEVTFVPAEPGTYRAKACVSTGPYPCSSVRGHVKDPN